MGIYDLIEDAEKRNEKRYVYCDVLSDLKDEPRLRVDINASGEEVKALMVALGLEICERENINPPTLFAKLAVEAVLGGGRGINFDEDDDDET